MSDDYHAYLIRFQRLAGQESWLASLENVHTGEKKGFANERDLLLFLLENLKKVSSGKDESIESIIQSPSE